MLSVESYFLILLGLPFIVRQRRQHNIIRRLPNSRTVELLTRFRQAGAEASMRQEELAALDSHEAVQPIRAARRIMAETGDGQFLPLAVGGANPLVAVQRFAAELAVVADKILTETVEALQIAAVL